MRRWLNWRLVKYSVIFVLVATVPLLGWIWYDNWLGDKRLREALAELDARGPWKWEDLVAARPADPDNVKAVDLILKVVAATGGTRAAFANVTFVDVFPDHPQVMLSPKSLALLEETIGREVAQLTEARRILELPRGRFHMHHNSDPTLDRVQKVREFASLLSYDAYYQAQLGDLDKALENCRATWRASRALEDELTVIPHLVRIAIEAIALGNAERTLAQGQPSPHALARMQQTLEESDLLAACRTGLIGERAHVDRVCKAIAAGGSALEAVMGVKGGPANVEMAPNIILRMSLNHSHAWLLKDLTETIDNLKLPIAADDPKALMRRMHEAPPLARMFMPASTKYREAFNRSLAKQQCAIAALAIERFRREHGRWPKALDELTPKFLAKMPEDPLGAAGKALGYRATPDGVVIWSVGPEGKLGGTYRDDGKADPRHGSYEFRLWNVPQRRQMQR